MRLSPSSLLSQLALPTHSLLLSFGAHELPPDDSQWNKGRSQQATTALATHMGHIPAAHAGADVGNGLS